MSTPTLTTGNTLLSKPPAALTKPPAPTASAQAATAAFAAKPKAAKTSRKAQNLADQSTEYLKLLIYSGTGCGKTLTVAHMLEAGLTVLVISTDMGGNGLASVGNHLRSKNKADLLKNCHYFECQSYDEVEDLIFNPEGFWEDIYKVDIDMVVFDGFSSMQQCLLNEKVLSMSGGNSATEAREAGLFASMQDWGAIKTGTVKILDKFLRMSNEKTGKPWHKLVTCLETDNAKDNSGEKKLGPMVQGAAAKLIEPSFDVIFRARKKKTTEGDKKVMTYFYETEGASDRVITKSRGFNLEINEPGDFGAFWKKLCEQKGITAGKR